MSDTNKSYDMLQTMTDNPESHLTDDERKEVDECYQAIDLSDSTAIIEYGSDIQKKLSELSERILLHLSSQNIDDIGDMLDTTVEYLRDIEEEKGIFSFIKKTKQMSVSEKYRTAEQNVDELTKSLQQHQLQLMKDCAMLSQIHYMNTVYFRALNVKILAAKRKLEDFKNKQLPALTKKAQEPGVAQDTLAFTDIQIQIDRLEKKIYELELTKNISLQSAPLIAHIRSNQETMAEKIQSILLNTIPLWKNQVIYALSMEQSNQAAAAETEINKVTNKMLIDSLDEVARIRQERTQHIDTAEHELVKMKMET